MVTIARFNKSEDAHLFRLRLSAAGIDAHVLDENYAQWFWWHTQAIGGIRVQIHDDDLDAAKEALLLPPHEWEDEERLVCPDCGSSKVEKCDPPLRWDFLGVLLLSVPLPFLPKTHRCASCDHKWRSP